MIDGKKILSALTLAGKTRAEYASALGMSTATLSRRIAGKTEFTLSEIQKSGELLGKEQNRDIFLL